jgi:DNA-directed RNA polymerase specialized sigma subunit
VHTLERATRTQNTLSPAQQQLVADHAHIVPSIARQLVKRFSLPYWIDIEEMISCGNLGLCNAALRFDPALGKFETFASWKVRGAILDGFLRRQAPATLPMISDDFFESELSNGGEEPIDPTPSIEDTLIAEQKQQT